MPMKQRLIKGMSLIPIRVGKLTPKRIGDAPAGLISIMCPGCSRINYRSPRAKPALCEHCRNIGIKLSRDQCEIAISAAMIERWTTNWVTNLSDRSVRYWCDTNIKYIGFRSYLSLDRRTIQPRLNSQKVSSRVYYNVLRFVVLNLVATDVRQLKFLEYNNKNILGVGFLEKSPVFISMFGSLDPYIRHPSGNFWETVPPPRTVSISDILAIYGVSSPIFGDSTDED